MYQIPTQKSIFLYIVHISSRQAYIFFLLFRHPEGGEGSMYPLDFTSISMGNLHFIFII